MAVVLLSAFLLVWRQTWRKPRKNPLHDSAQHLLHRYIDAHITHGLNMLTHFIIIHLDQCCFLHHLHAGGESSVDSSFDVDNLPNPDDR